MVVVALVVAALAPQMDSAVEVNHPAVAVLVEEGVVEKEG